MKPMSAPAQARPQSRRMAGVQSPVIPIVGELIRDHPGTISLGQGVVSYGPPPEAFDRIDQFSANPSHHKYQLVQGIAPLLSAIETKLSEENQIRVDAAREVVVTAGSNMAFNNALLAIADPGDEIILPSPYYFNHEMAIEMASCRAVVVPTDTEHQLDLDALESSITKRTRAIVTISPNNPSGAVYSETSLRAVNDLCRERNLYHISDEAYEYFTYEDACHFSPGSIEGASAHTISLFSLSKAYGFASWRIGYQVIPPHLLAPIKKIQDTILICPPVISQYAATGALEAGPSFWEPQISKLAEIRNLVLNELEALHSVATVARAKGAFYVLVRINSAARPMEVIRHLVENHRVAAIPGTAFGLESGCFLRLAYAALPKESIVEGVGRFIQGVQSFVHSSQSP
tara:strand:+ start:720 stop:1928 length:1209 start_codon:yes stop_codon:yes gene_type:complete